MQHYFYQPRTRSYSNAHQEANTNTTVGQGKKHSGTLETESGLHPQGVSDNTDSETETRGRRVYD